MDFQLNLTTESVTQICLKDAVTCATSDTILEVTLRLREQVTGAAMIISDDGVLEGISTERDALKLMASQGSFDQPISAVMTGNPTTIPSTASVAEAISKMSSGGYRRLPVVDSDGKPIGLVKTSLLVHYLVEHFPEVIYNLPPDPHHVTQEREGA